MRGVQVGYRRIKAGPGRFNWRDTRNGVDLTEHHLGFADDYEEADGGNFLSWPQVCNNEVQKPPGAAGDRTPESNTGAPNPAFAPSRSTRRPCRCASYLPSHGRHTEIIDANKSDFTFVH